MTFNLHQLDSLTYDEAEPLLESYIDQAIETFAHSPEAKVYLETHETVGSWIGSFLELAYQYEGYTLSMMAFPHVQEIMESLFPRKITLLDPSQALDAIPELICFWQFLKRQYKLKKANSIIQYLASIESTFPQIMNDPHSGDFLKNILLQGHQLEFDLTQFLRRLKNIKLLFFNFIKPLFKIHKWLLAGLLSLLINLNFSSVLSQSNESPGEEINQLQTESQIDYEQGNFLQSAEQLQTLINRLIQKNNDPQNLAIAWQNAENLYRQLNQEDKLLNLFLNQSQAWQKLGYYPRSCQILSLALRLEDAICDSQAINQSLVNQKLQETQEFVNFKLNLKAWRILADNLRQMGRLTEAQIILKTLVEIPNNPNLSSIQLSLGNTLTAMGNLEIDRKANPNYEYIPWRCDSQVFSPENYQTYYHSALIAYENAQTSHSIITKTNGQINQLSLLVKLGKKKEADSLNKIINLKLLPQRVSKIFAQINYSKSLTCLQQQQSVDLEQLSEPVLLILEQAKEEAIQLNVDASALFSVPHNVSYSQEKNSSILSYTIGTLGSFYEYLSWQFQHQDLNVKKAQEYQEKAIQLTQKALYLAQPNIVPHLAYQWQWQMGRLLSAKGDNLKAIAYYESAIKTLETVRRDLLTINTDIQFSFRDNIEPLYRQLIFLLTSTKTSQNNEINLNKSIYYLEALQLAELENFLQCNLIDISDIKTAKKIENLSQKIEQKFNQNTTAALLYPIILENQIITILKLPNQPLRYHSYPINYQRAEKTLNQLQIYLKYPSRTNSIKDLSSEVYDWLIKPIEQDLERTVDREKSQIKTLVWALDTSFRNIPMSLLYDNQRNQYLLERYSLALVSSTQLLKPTNSPPKITALLGGLSQQKHLEDKIYPPLPNVLQELKNIQSVVPSRLVINEDLTKNTLEETLKSGKFSLLHLATHGQFSSDPQKTFIVLFDQTIKEEELSKLLTTNQPIEMLVLSACETATGDKRAVLGLAGVAIRSEVSSTVATLWQVDDESTAILMSYFYQQLQENPQINKAEALRKAQLKLWENKQKDWEIPFFWGPYILVGNWS